MRVPVTKLFTSSVLCMPFMRFNDPNRLQMASNHLRQSITLLDADIPKIRTGYENMILKHAESFYLKTRRFNRIDTIAETDYGMRYVSPFMEYNKELEIAYDPYHVALVRDVISSAICPELKLGKNVLVAYGSYYGFNYQDAIVISESFARKTKHIDKQVYIVKIPSEFEFYPVRAEDGTVSMFPIPGKIYQVVLKYSYYKNGMIKYEEIVTDNALVADIRANILPNTRVPPYLAELAKRSFKPFRTIGLKTDIEPTKQFPIVLQIVVYRVARTTIGDKFTNRHGNKGVVGLIVPDEEMPKTSDGKVIDVIFSPLSVPSRMNIGQLYENLLAKIVVKVEEKLRDLLDRNKTDAFIQEVIKFYSAVEKRETIKHVVIKKLKENYEIFIENFNNYGLSITQPHFYELSATEIMQLAKQYDVSELEPVNIDGTTVMLNVGYQTILKLEHLARSKITGAGISNHAEANPQRVGEMETWNIAAHDFDEVERLFRRTYEYKRIQYYADKYNIDTSEYVEPEYKNPFQVYEAVITNKQ